MGHDPFFEVQPEQLIVALIASIRALPSDGCRGGRNISDYGRQIGTEAHNK